MTNAPTISTGNMTRSIARITGVADHAPMVIPRLSGWINVGESKVAAPAWIFRRARVHADRKVFSPNSAGLQPA